METTCLPPSWPEFEPRHIGNPFSSRVNVYSQTDWAIHGHTISLNWTVPSLDKSKAFIWMNTCGKWCHETSMSCDEAICWHCVHSGRMLINCGLGNMELIWGSGNGHNTCFHTNVRRYPAILLYLYTDLSWTHWPLGDEAVILKC